VDWNGQPVAECIFDARARPSEVFGPLLSRAFAWLAWVLRSLVMGAFFALARVTRSRGIGRPQCFARSAACFAQCRPVPVQFAEGGIAVSRGDAIRREIAQSWRGTRFGSDLCQ